MCTVRKAQTQRNVRDGIFGVDQIVFRFIQTKCHAVIEETHFRVLVCNSIQIIAAVIKRTFQFGAADAAVVFFKEMADTGKEQEIIVTV